MNDFRLLVFCKVAEKGSFTRAARELYITQPAVSKHIQSLEKELNVRLLERNKSALRLTPAGVLLLRHAEGILTAYKQLELEMSLLQNRISGELLIGASTTIAQYVLPPLLARFREHYPNLKIVLYNQNTEQIEKMLFDKRIHLGVVEGQSHKSGLEYSRFMRDELVAVVNRKGTLARYDSLTLAQLKTIPLVLREYGSGTLEVLENQLQARQLRFTDLNVVMQLGSTESIKLYLKNADCMGIVSVRAVAQSIVRDDFKVVDIEGLNLERLFHFVYLQGNPEPLSERFMQFARLNDNQSL